MISQVGSQPITKKTSSRTGSLMSAWISSHRLTVTGDQFAFGQQRDQHRNQDPEQGLQKLHRAAFRERAGEHQQPAHAKMPPRERPARVLSRDGINSSQVR